MPKTVPLPASTRSARFPRRDMDPLPHSAELSATVAFRPSTRAIESRSAPRHSMPMCALQPSASPLTGVSTDELTSKKLPRHSR